MKQTRRGQLVAAGADLAVLQTATEVLAGLAAVNVRPLLLKGPAVRSVYPVEVPRASGDVDLLVRVAETDRAIQVIRSLGYLRVSKPADDAGFVHADVWQRRPGAVTVDLHRRLAGARASADEIFKCLFDSSIPMPIGSCEVHVPAGAGLAVVLVLHAAAHGRDFEQPLDDLRHALRALPHQEWTEARRLAERLDAHDAFEAGLLLAGGGELQVSGRVDVRLRAGSAPHTALGFQRVAERPGFQAKLRDVARTAFPASEVLWGWHRIARRGRIGLAVAYLLRLAWLARWAGPGFSAWLRARRQVRRQG